MLSTLHTNSAAASITRLLDMGVESYLIASTVNGILAQRLVRRLDPATREAFDAPPELIAEHGTGASPTSARFACIARAPMRRVVVIAGAVQSPNCWS